MILFCLSEICVLSECYLSSNFWTESKYVYVVVGGRVIQPEVQVFVKVSSTQCL